MGAATRLRRPIAGHERDSDHCPRQSWLDSTPTAASGGAAIPLLRASHTDVRERERGRTPNHVNLDDSPFALCVQFAPLALRA